MDDVAAVIATLRWEGRPLRYGQIADATGLDRPRLRAAMEQAAADGYVRRASSRL